MKVFSKNRIDNLAAILTIIACIILIGQFVGVLSIQNLFNQENHEKHIGESYAKSINGKTTQLNNLLAVGDNCAPDAGYDDCDKATWGTVQAIIMVSDDRAEKRIAGGYYVGGAYELAKASGTNIKLYQGRNKMVDDFDNTCQDPWYEDSGPWCSASGFNLLSNPYKFILANPGQSFTDCTVYIAYADNLVDATYSSYGYEGNGNCRDIKAVNCYDSSDCSLGSHCSSIENPTNWQSWSCVPNECTPPAEKCLGTDYYQCSSSTYKYQNKGKVVGKCGVSCTTDSQCSNLNVITNNTCTEDNKAVVQYITKGVCALNVCSSNKTTLEVSKCDYGCTNGTCNELNLIWLYISIGAVVLIILVLIIYKTTRKRRRR